MNRTMVHWEPDWVPTFLEGHGLFGPAEVRTVVRGSILICNFGSDQTEKSETVDQTRASVKAPLVYVIKSATGTLMSPI